MCVHVCGWEGRRGEGDGRGDSRVTGITEITEIPTEITEITMEITEITMEGWGGGRYDTLGWIRIG